MDFFYDIARYAYLHNALAACILSGIACGIMGTYVVCRRTVFLAGGITHASFGGLGIAFYLGLNPIAGALVFAVLSALGIEWAGNRGRIREDSAIGIIWSVGMALGVLFMSLRPGYTSGDLSAYLFGSIVTVTHGDVTALAVLTLFIIAGALLWLRPVMYVAFDRDFARSRGIEIKIVPAGGLLPHRLPERPGQPHRAVCAYCVAAQGIRRRQAAGLFRETVVAQLGQGKTAARRGGQSARQRHAGRCAVHPHQPCCICRKGQDIQYQFVCLFHHAATSFFLHFIQLSVYREQGVIVQCRERFELFCANGARHPAALPVLPFCHISFKFSVLPVPPKGNCRIKQKRQLSKAVFFVVQ